MTYRILAILLLGVLAVSCGGSDDKSAKSKATDTKSTTASKATDAKDSKPKETKPGQTPAGKKSELAGTELTKDQKRSYLYGVNIGRNIAFQLMRSPTKIDKKTFLVGIKDSVEGNKIALNDAQIKAVIKELQEEHIANLRKRFKSVIDKGDKYLAKMKKEKGVVEDSSGVLYKVVKKGTGASPTLKDKVKVHYTGLRIDGKKFDSSVDRGKPVVFDLSQRGLIKGWLAALPKMKEGARWKLYIPSKMAYGWRGSPPTIRPFEVLVFNIELIKVNPKPEKAAAKPAAKKAAAKKPAAKK
jgi:FKBP-type peptidyl-prolyl cis-trans isomerase